MTFQPPVTRQDQSRKVLEEVQMQKKLLKQGAAVSLNPAPAPAPAPGASDTLTTAQRQALQHAHNSSFGFFVVQDSSFGNITLPVIPRIDPPKQA